MRQIIANKRIQNMCMCCRMSESRLNTMAEVAGLCCLRPDRDKC